MTVKVTVEVMQLHVFLWKDVLVSVCFGCINLSYYIQNYCLFNYTIYYNEKYLIANTKCHKQKCMLYYFNGLCRLSRQ